MLKLFSRPYYSAIYIQ